MLDSHINVTTALFLTQGIADTPQGGGKEEQSRARPSTHASDLLLLSLVMIWVANRIL